MCKDFNNIPKQTYLRGNNIKHRACRQLAEHSERKPYLYIQMDGHYQYELIMIKRTTEHYSPAYITNTKNPKVRSEAGMFPIHSSNPVTTAVHEFPNTHVPATPILVNVYGVT